jgi:hypothetical protein
LYYFLKMAFSLPFSRLTVIPSLTFSGKRWLAVLHADGKVEVADDEFQLEAARRVLCSHLVHQGG